MSRWSILILIILLPCFGNSQIGLTARYLFGQSEILEANDISQNGLQTAIEYHLKLKEMRVEFRPAVGYRFTFNAADYSGHFRAFDFDANVAVYPFDFEGDCDCPTFSKEGNLIKKGFFIELNPGISYQLLTRLRSEPDDPQRLPIRSKNFVFKIGGSAGLDIGISEHFTITPMFSATLLSASDWEGLNVDGSTGRLDDYIYMGTGIRITYSSDDKRRRRN